MAHISIRRIALNTLLAGVCVGRAMAAYEDVGVGARVTGLGHAYTAVADDVYSVYYNPAGLATLDRPEFGTTYSKLLTGLSDGSAPSNSFLAYAHPLDGGRKGTLGVGWNEFTLSGLYRESQFLASYGRALFPSTSPNRYYLGATLKYLNRSIGGTAEAASGISNTGQATGMADPVLQNASKGNFDADLGFLWRVKPRWTLGLMIQHLMEPNVGFAATDKLGRNIKFGGSYKTPFSTLTGDARLQSAPDGSTDKILAVGAEKWLPTLLHGSFGVRGSLSTGSRDFRQMSFGLSYKISRMQFDYGFALPIGGLTATSGSHRMGLTFRFGRARGDEAAFNEAILENLRDLAQVGTPEFHYQMQDLALYKRTAIDEFLRQANLDAAAGRYANSADKLSTALSLSPKDDGLRQSQERMNTVAEVIPELVGYQTDAALAAVYESAYDYMTGNAKNALKKLAYAASLNSADERIERLAQAIETKSGVLREAAPTQVGEPAKEQAAESVQDNDGAKKAVAGLMALLEVAMRERDYERVMKLASEVVQVDPSNLLAYKRLSAAAYGLKRHDAALKAVRAALRLEKDPVERARLKSYIDALTNILVKQRQDAAHPAVVEAAITPQEIEHLYDAGVALYASGRLEEAAATFRKLLVQEPNNIPARRALDRIQSEILQSGGAR